MLFGKIFISNIGDDMVNVNNNDYRLRPVKMPCDDEFYERPFFAYGIFKKGQLAHSKISDCVENIVPDEIPYELHIRDGYPLIKKERSENTTKGEKIRFNQRMCAYQRISNTMPGNIYKWDTTVIDGETYNVLVTDDLEGTFQNVDDDGDYRDAYDGHDDPFFYKVPAFICEELRNLVYDENVIFRIQMYYILLWSAIERYSKLKYDVSNKESDYLYALANDNIYRDAFQIVDPENMDSIHAANNAREYIFDKSNPNYIVNYYYTLRCNVTHRGKELRNNTSPLRRSLKDLVEIFELMIKMTFDY